MPKASDACVSGGIELVRALGLAGVRSTLVVPRGVPARQSRYASHAVDPRGRPVVDALVEYAAIASEPLPLFFDSDQTLEEVSRNRDRLNGSYLFELPDPELTEDLLDKARFRRLAERLSLPVPPARTIRPAASDPSDLEIAFPVVLKPTPFKDERWHQISGGAKAIRVGDRNDLEALWPQLADTGLDFLAQEVVPGPETCIVSYHAYIDSAGDIAGEFTGRKIRTRPLEFGASASLVTTDEPDVAAVGRELVERLGLRGAVKFDLKRAADGRLWLLEVNTRFTLWVHPGAVAGVNLAAIAHADMTGAPRPRVRRARPGVRWVAPGSDLAAAREAGVPLWRWVPWVLTSETNAVFAWNDPGPLTRRALARIRPPR